MQTLRLKKKDQEGQEATVAVAVLRSWQDWSGKNIYLHTNGVYGYKDGSPVMSEDELDIIGSRVQREMAKQWWKSTGKELSRQYYEQQLEAERAAAGDFQTVEDAPNTELDHVLYRRRESKGGKKGKWSKPFAWMECFDRRPDWWGQAEHIVLPDWEYEKVNSVSSQAAVSGDVDPEEV